MTRTQREELDARTGNRKIAIRARAIEIIRQTPGILTMAEAVDMAGAEFKAGLLARPALVQAGMIDPRD